jgi:hypothetical protein
MNRTLQRLVVVAALGVAAFLLVSGFMMKSEQEPPVRRAGLVQVFPQPATVTLRQDAVGAVLEFGWDGRLQIDGRGIPDDQLERIPGINRVSFTPGPGKEIESLDEGRHCASLFFWPSAAGESANDTPHVWCFTSA